MDNVFFLVNDMDNVWNAMDSFYSGNSNFLTASEKGYHISFKIHTYIHNVLYWNFSASGFYTAVSQRTNLLLTRWRRATDGAQQEFGHYDNFV